MKKIKILGLAFLVSFFIFSAQTSNAATFQSHSKGIQIGNSSTALSEAGDNLLYGVVSSSATGSLILLQNELDVDTFKLDFGGNITKVGNITADGDIDVQGDMCFNGDCKVSWADVSGGGDYIQDQLAVSQTANFRISGVGVATAFVTTYFNVGDGASVVNVIPAAGKEGIKIVSSNSSSLVIRNTTDTADLLRVTETGDLQVTTINSRSFGTGSGNISINAGQGLTNVGLSANYIEGHDWSEISNLLSTIPPSTPEKHYFISAATTNAAVAGFSGFDSLCNNDANAISGRSYHVYADDSTTVTNRGFKSGVLYSNATYGTFATIDSQSPDLCRVLGISCDTNWIGSSSDYVWNTNINGCVGWTTAASGNVNSIHIYSPLNTGLSVGTIAGPQSYTQCSTARSFICVEDSGGVITNPGSICGNGVLEFGEGCDDNNTVDDSTCPANCQADGGYCGDGYDATDEACEYLAQKWTGNSWSTYQATGQCTTSCTWAADTDGDTYTGQFDCWNNDANAKPGSLYQSTTAKDYDCSGFIDYRTECISNDSLYAVASSVCPSPNTQSAADAWCNTQHAGSTSSWRCNGEYNEVGCVWCTATVTYYW